MFRNVKAGYQKKDHYYYEAKNQGYAARSVFKLQEIDAKYRILKRGSKILDLGAAPGSWSQFASEKIGQEGRILAIDLEDIRLTIPVLTFLKADLLALDPAQIQIDGQTHFDAVLSDMAPKTTGIKFADQARSEELCLLALRYAESVLRPGGHFVCKLFHSAGFAPLKKKMTALFENVQILRPQSTRKESSEVFLIGLRRRAN